MLEAGKLAAKLEERSARALDLRFTDLLGGWRHVSIDAGAIGEDGIDRYAMFDGSAVPGWRDIVESDLLLRPEPERAWADPFTAQPTLLCIADVVDPATIEGYERCPRSALKRTIDTVRGSGLADGVRVGADLAFYVFDALEVAREEHALGFRARPMHDAARPALEARYLAGQPEDTLADLRAEMTSVLSSLGVEGLSHVLLRGPGQCELRFGPTDALTLADQLQLARYVVDNVARAYGKVPSFLPMPLPRAPGSGLHLHLALEREGEWLFAGQGYADLSDTCLYAIGGILRHTVALNALTNPSTNSYRRLRVGRHEPSLVGFGARNRSTTIRIPSAARPEDKRIELRFPDPLMNPYLALAGVLHAVRDGVAHAIDPGEPVDRNIYDLVADEGGMERCARDLGQALAALGDDVHELFAGDDVPVELIHAYIALKRQELDLIEAQPHPLEHAVYGD
jgi:glutamine synthetase